MKIIILWFFGLISDLVSYSMNFKIYGNLSLFHFVLGFNFLILLLKLLSFGFNESPSFVRLGVIGYKNAENKRDKANYYHMSKSVRNGNIITTTRYKVNRKTGEYNEI